MSNNFYIFVVLALGKAMIKKNFSFYKVWKNTGFLFFQEANSELNSIVTIIFFNPPERNMLFHVAFGNSIINQINLVWIVPFSQQVCLRINLSFFIVLERLFKTFWVEFTFSNNNFNLCKFLKMTSFFLNYPCCWIT